MELMELWKTEKPIYFQVNEFIENKLNDLIKKHKIKAKVSARVKEDIDLKRKLLSKGYTKKAYSSITDKSGLRIICCYISDLNMISKIIEENFEIVKKEDRRFTDKPNYIGYQAIHIEVRLKKDETNIDKELLSLISEIQIKTTLQSAWGDNSHDLTYKNIKDIPPEVVRKINLLNAIIEVADNEFENVYNEIKELNVLSVYGLFYILIDLFDKNFNYKFNANFTYTFLEKFYDYFKIQFTVKEFNSVITEFLDNNIEILLHAFENRRPEKDELVYFKQPETIFIFYALVNDKFNFIAEWKKILNFDTLLSIASWFNLPIE